MTPTRHRSAWIWVAVAAMSLAFVARAQSGAQNARVYTNPVLEFLAGHPNAQPEAANTVQRFLHSRTARVKLYGSGAGVWAAMLPVLFVGLVSPLNLLSPKSFRCIGRAPAAPSLPFSYQRPPPATIL
jgi:hypothetical protein